MEDSSQLKKPNLCIEPDCKITLPALDEAVVQLLEDEQEEYTVRILLQDLNNYGVMLPAKINSETKTPEFLLPEQLCIFSPEETYVCRLEIVLDSQELLVPFVSEVWINIKAPSEPEEQEEEELDDREPEVPVKSRIEPPDSDPDLDAVLDAVAPLTSKESGTNGGGDVLEQIAKQLDGEFVRNALWQRRNQQMQQPVPVPIAREPEPAAAPKLSPAQQLIKNQMKALLRKTLVG